MKIAKRLLIVFLVLIVLVIGALFAIPMLYKAEILDLAKVEINKNLKAKVEFSDLSLSLFRSFPDMNVSLADFSVTGIDTFEGLNLFKAKNMALSVDLMSVLRGGGEVKVNEISLTEPDINVLVLKDGLANYDITIPTEEQVDTSTTDYTGLAMELSTYSIENGRLIYDDHSTDTYVAIAGLDHQGEGNFTLDVYDLITTTTIDSLTAVQGGIGYLTNVRSSLEAIFNINLPESKYTLKDNLLKINELELKADGFVQMPEDDINMDLSFSAPANDFRQLWSIIPNAYTEGYEQVKIDGQFSLLGQVKGVYSSEREEYPSFKIATDIKNGNVKYPDLPMSISGIIASLEVNSPSSQLDDMVINLSKLNLKVGGDPFAAHFILRTPLSDPDLDLNVDGIIDLAKWAQAFPIPDIEQMAGRIVADVDMKTRLSTIEREAYEEVNIRGAVRATNIKYKGAGLPPVLVSKANAVFTPKRIEISELDMKLGRSDLSGTGYINNILAYFSPGKTMTGNMVLRSNFFDADEWMEEDPTASAPVAYAPAVAAEREAAAAPVAEEAVFDRFDFQIDAEAKKIRYDVYELKDSRMVGRIMPNRMELTDMATVIGDSDIKGSGLLLNAFDYTFGDGVLGGNFDFQSNYLNLNQFMGDTETTTTTTTTASTTVTEPMLVPANISMTIGARAKKIDYTNMSLTDFSGRLLVKDEQVVIEDGTTNTLGGKLAFDGAYDTQDAENPYFNFKYDLQSMDFQQSFATLNTFQQLAPIGKFIQGRFSTSMVMDGILGKDMMPKFSTLNADGFLETLNGIVSGFEPLAAVGNSLDIKELKESMQLNNLKSWFSIRDGKVEVKPFDVKLKNIAMNIAGSHGLDQEMSYQIKSVIPRSMLTGSAVGQAANKGVNALLSQAASLGVNVSQSENLNVLINLTGSITKPKVGFKLLGADGETSATAAAETALRDEFNEQKDEIRKEVDQRVNDARKQAETAANKALDSAKVVANQKMDELQRQAGQAARDKLGTVVDSATLKRMEGQGQQTIDGIKDNLQQWNPLKRKRGGGG